MTRETLTGWGRSTTSVADVEHLPSVAAVRDAVCAGTASGRGVLARGLGRSYGDAASNGGGTVLRLDGLGSIGPVSADGLVVLGAGASLDRVLAAVVPQGWFLPVTPGTQHVTVGGAVSADVHGKNHHADGSLAGHLVWLEVVDGLGQVRRVTRGDGAFDAVVGGMGLAGVVTRVCLRLRPIPSSSITVRTTRTADLATTMAQLEADDAIHRYTVAWLDTLAPGRSLGRGVVTSGDHTPADDPDGRPLRAYRARPLVAAPPWAPSGLLTSRRVRAFNTAYYHRAPRRPRVTRETIPAFFHPLDVVAGWNRLYGSRGFIQHQFAVADAALVQEVLTALQRERVTGFLAILKRFGRGNGLPLSFPMPGWTLAVDVPAAPEVAGLLDRLDERIVAAGGRHYLAKDGRVRPSLVPLMYPDLDRWRELREELDPRHVFASDLSRRLQLC